MKKRKMAALLLTLACCMGMSIQANADDYDWDHYSIGDRDFSSSMPNAGDGWSYDGNGNFVFDDFHYSTSRQYDVSNWRLITSYMYAFDEITVTINGDCAIYEVYHNQMSDASSDGPEVKYIVNGSLHTRYLCFSQNSVEIEGGTVLVDGNLAAPDGTWNPGSGNFSGDYLTLNDSQVSVDVGSSNVQVYKRLSVSGDGFLEAAGTGWALYLPEEVDAKLIDENGDPMVLWQDAYASKDGTEAAHYAKAVAADTELPDKPNTDPSVDPVKPVEPVEPEEPEEPESSSGLSIQLNTESLSLMLGEGFGLKADIATASNAAAVTVASASNALEWKSEDGSLVEIAGTDGTEAKIRVIGYRFGEKNVVSVFAGADEYDLKAGCEVTVTAPVLTVEESAVTLKREESSGIAAALTGVASGIQADSYSYQSSDPAIAAVSEDGVITAGRKSGNAEIIVSAYLNGMKIAETSVAVRVRNESSDSSGNSDSSDDSDYSGNSGNSGSGSASAPYYDGHKGLIDPVKGVMIGTGLKYARWESTEAGWWLRYADGSYPKGALLLDADGNAKLQLAWELVNGAWYAFDAEGYAVSGLIVDFGTGDTFYIDINRGMLVGWQQIGGKWYYFQEISDGRKGRMLKNEITPDGYFVDKDGVWTE